MHAEGDRARPRRAPGPPARTRPASAPAAPRRRPGRPGRAAPPRSRRPGPRCARCRRPPPRRRWPPRPPTAPGPRTRTWCTKGRARTRTAASGRPSCRCAARRCATAGRWTGCAPGSRGISTGSLPLGVTRPVSTPAMRAARPPRRGRTPAPRPASRSATPPSAYGRPVTSTATTGSPVSASACSSSSWAPGSFSSVDVAALAAGPVPEQAGLVPDDRHDHISRNGCG